MAIAQDALSVFEADGTVFTISHTVSGSDRAITFLSSRWNNGGETVNSVTYNGVSLSVVTEQVAGERSADGHACGIWVLAAPATGANDLVVTMSATTSMNGEGVSWTGVDQTTPADGGAEAVGTTTAVTVDVTSASGDRVIDVVGWYEGTNADLTAGGGQTEIYARHNTGPTYGAGSHENGAGTVTMSWTLGAAANWAQCACNLNAAAAAVGLMGAICT
jgi:hypothetical protein